MEAHVYETRRRDFNWPTRVKIEDSAGDGPQLDYDRVTIKMEGVLGLAESKVQFHSLNVTNG